MHRLVLLLLALALAPACSQAHAGAWPGLPIAEYLQSGVALTQSLPTLSTEGMDWGHVVGFRVSVCGVGGNLQGVGNIRDEVYVPTQAKWVHNPSGDLAITNTGVACQLWGDLSASVHQGRFKPISDGITLSAGTTLNILVEASVQ